MMYSLSTAIPPTRSVERLKSMPEQPLHFVRQALFGSRQFACFQLAAFLLLNRRRELAENFGEFLLQRGQSEQVFGEIRVGVGHLCSELANLTFDLEQRLLPVGDFTLEIDLSVLQHDRFHGLGDHQQENDRAEAAADHIQERDAELFYTTSSTFPHNALI